MRENKTTFSYERLFTKTHFEISSSAKDNSKMGYLGQLTQGVQFNHQANQESQRLLIKLLKEAPLSPHNTLDASLHKYCTI